MTERRISPAEMEAVRTTRLIVLEIVAQDPGIPFVQLSEKFSQILGERRANGGITTELGFGPGKSSMGLEQFVYEMANEKQGLLQRKGSDGISTFRLTAQGNRVLTLNGKNSDTEKPTPQL